MNNNKTLKNVTIAIVAAALGALAFGAFRIYAAMKELEQGLESLDDNFNSDYDGE